jgi:dipeptidyl-peptidase 4
MDQLHERRGISVVPAGRGWPRRLPCARSEDRRRSREDTWKRLGQDPRPGARRTRIAACCVARRRLVAAAAAVLAWTLCAAPALAQLSPNVQDILRRIHTTQEFGPGTRGPGAGGRWVDGGAGYTAAERGQSGATELVRYDTATGRREVVLTSARLTPPSLGAPLRFTDYAVSADGRRWLFASNSRPAMIRKTAYDYWTLDTASGDWRRLGAPAEGGLLYAKLSPDGTRAAYVRDNNLFVEDLRTGAATALTSDGSPMIINGTSDWVYEEELGLRDAFEWSPDGRRIAYYQFDQNGVPEFTLINYTDALYPALTRYPYPKAGQTNASVRIGVVAATGGPTRWMKIPGDPRDTYVARMAWAANLDELVLQHLNRLQNTNTVLLANASSGEVRTMFVDQDDAWVDYNETFTWIERGRRLIFESERDGWRHVYAVSRDGDARLVTTGAFDLLSVSGVDEAGGWLYYIASPGNATQRYLYRSRLDGIGQPERVTPASASGTHTYNLSPDCRWAFHGDSRFDMPGQSDLVRLPDHAVQRVFQANAELKAKVGPILAGRTELLQVDIGGGVVLDGWLIKPRAFDAAKKYPIVVYVYGEPAGTTVTDSWGGSNRVLLAAIADEGYLIASFDNRGTPSLKGRAWRKVIYGAVGVLASQEQAAALEALAASRPYVDLSRVGVYGWSGGGSMTLNLMFRSPGLYNVGVAGAPVPDQTLYDSIYQERYMGLPRQNAEGYRTGSPITYAEGLEGKLLVIHGTGDDNVHFQGTQRLLNRLIELNKQFSFMEYPNRRHGISGLHVDTLRWEFITQHLPAGAR